MLHKGWSRSWSWSWWLLAPLLVLAAYRGVLGFDFIGDAHFLILENRFMREPGGAWQQVLHNYFWSSSGNIIPYWRPWTKLSWYWEYQLFGPWAAGFMVVQAGWHLLGVAGVQLLARMLGAARPGALLSGLIFALHPVALAPVCMLMARSDVAAACGLVWCLTAWIGWSRGGRPAWLILLFASLAVALASKEAAVIAPVIMGGWVLGSKDLRGSWKHWLPPLAGAALLVAAYLVLRSAVLNADAPGLEAVGIELNPARIWAGLAMYLKNLFPFWVTSGVRDVPWAEAVSGRFILWGALTLLSAAGFCVSAWRRGDYPLFWLVCWAGLAIAPVLFTAGIHVPASAGKYPMADRWLYHALAPAALAWGRLLPDLGRLLPWGKLQTRALAGVGLALWCAALIWNSAAATREFGSVDGMLDNEDRAYYHAVPERFRSEEDKCRYLDRKVVRALRAGDDPMVAKQALAAAARCGESPERGYWRLSSLVARGRFKEAEPLVRRLIKAPPRDRRGHADLARLAGVVLLKTGHAPEAETWLRSAVKLGARGCRLLINIAEANRAQGKNRQAAGQLMEAYRCGGSKDPSLLIMAATITLQAGDQATARSLLQGAAKHRLSSDQQAQAERLKEALRR